MSVETLVDWLANRSPPWAAYQAFISGRLIELYKITVVRLVGVRENCHRRFANCVLNVKGSEATHTFKYDQLRAVLKAGISGAVHGVKFIWDANSTEENWYFLLVDAKNTLNKINCIRMLWMVCHL